METEITPLSFKCKIVTAVLCSQFDNPSGRGLLCLLPTILFALASLCVELSWFNSRDCKQNHGSSDPFSYTTQMVRTIILRNSLAEHLLRVF